MAKLDEADPMAGAAGLLAGLLARVRAQAFCYQTMHWRARGPSFYGDHLLFERLYTGAVGEVDAVAEKALGVTGYASAVDPVAQAVLLAGAVKEILGAATPEDPAGGAARLLEEEREFCGAYLVGLSAGLGALGVLTPGLENFLQGLADAHEGRVYLLRQRLAA